MLWLCYNAPHLPLTVAPRHEGRYPDAEVPIPADVFPPRPDKPAHRQVWTQWKKRDDEMPVYGRAKSPLPQTVVGYNWLVCTLDEGVGRLLKALEEIGQLDNTLIVYTSDQGFAWGEHGFAWKVGGYDATIKPPMIFRLASRVVPSQTCAQPVSVVDLGPNLLSIAGVRRPWRIYGRDLSPLLKQPANNPNWPLVMEHFNWVFGEQSDLTATNCAVISALPSWISLRHERYKYISTLVANKVEELYDLEADPAELQNLALQPANARLLINCRRKLVAELKRTKAGPGE